LSRRRTVICGGKAAVLRLLDIADAAAAAS